MTFDFPLRVRCIEGSTFFRRGEEYRALRVIGLDHYVIDAPHPLLGIKARFKPIVRRQAGSIRV